VLNAFRHHRGGHNVDVNGPTIPGRCSTPFGITEVGMRRAAARQERAKGCSTPFGITEVGIAASDFTPRESRRAQRLSASQRWAYPARSRRELLNMVLNAFRHHRGGHDHCAHGPQRRPVVLNAFRHHRGGHNGSTKERRGSRVCSTPFGITEVGMESPRAQESGMGMCSTPFGITEVGITRGR